TPLASAPFGRGKDDWRSFYEIFRSGMDPRNDFSAVAIKWMVNAYNDNDPQQFNKVLDIYTEKIQKLIPDEIGAVSFEVLFNRFEPFHQATVLYIFAFLLGCLSWLGWSRALTWSAYFLCLVAFLVHTWAIFGRCYILGRPPVINLYSTAV